jgi:hypothetical protein
MSSTLFKVVLAGAVTAGALFLPVTAAQAAADWHHPCNDRGFGDGGFLGDGFGFQNDGFGFGDDSLGFPSGGFGFHDDSFALHDHHRQHNHTTVIIVTPAPTKAHKHHKPATTGNATSDGGSGYQKPAATRAGSDGYHKSIKES